MKTKRVIYEGRVQGVGFRYTVKEIARGFEVSGSVRNLADGTVELYAAGEAEEVEEFLREIRVESPLSRHIRGHFEEVVENPATFRGFVIER